MRRVALAALLGLVSLLIAYRQFQALPTHPDAPLDLATTIPDVLAVFSAGSLLADSSAFLLASAKFVLLLAFH